MAKDIKELLEFGFINIDKPSGPTSFQVSDYVKLQLGLRKTSHLGTLDPGVSGVLPIGLNRACKLSTYLMRKDKAYVGIMRMHETVSDELLKKCMKEFTGKIKQKPPVRSNVSRQVREREIRSFNFLERDGNDILFDCEVEAGTYIRTLVNDLGKKIGGAHMLELRRMEAGIFHESKCVSLYEFDKAVDSYKAGNESQLRKIIIDAAQVIKESMKTIEIKEKNIDKILRGKPIHTEDLIKKMPFDKGSFIGIFCKGKFIEIARVIDEQDVFAVPDFVLN